jgi:DegV family protein with EDD domain
VNKIAIVTDGSSDIPQELVKKYRIYIVPFRVVFGEEVYKTYGDWGSFTKEEFYHKLKTSEEFPTTAIPSPKDFHEVYQEALENADRVIGIFLSQNFSGFYQEAVKVKEQFLKDSNITLIDSKVATLSLGVLVLQAAKMAAKGETKESIIQKINELIPNARLLVVLDSVDAVHRSGRVGWAKKFLVSSLQIKPIVNFRNGLIVPGGTLRKSNEVIKRLKFVAPIIMKEAITEEIFIWHVRYPEAAQEIYDLMESKNDMNKEIRIQEAGPVVGAHVGEKSIGFMYIGDYNKKWILKMKEK